MQKPIQNKQPIMAIIYTRRILYLLYLWSLHTDAASRYMDNITANRVFQTSSPEVAVEEKNLPCPYMTSLSKFRSSFCRSLQSY